MKAAESPENVVIDRLLTCASKMRYDVRPCPVAGRFGSRVTDDPKSFAVISSVGQIADHSQDIATQFFRAHIKNPTMPEREFVKSIAPLIEQCLRQYPNAGRYSLDDQPAVIYSSRFGTTNRLKQTSRLRFKDEYTVSGLLDYWPSTMLKWKWAIQLMKSLKWQIPEDCEQNRHMVLLRRQREITDISMIGAPPWSEITEIIGYGNLDNPSHAECLNTQRYLPAQQSAITDDGGWRIIAQPSLTVGWGLSPTKSHIDAISTPYTFSFDTNSGRLVGIFLPRECLSEPTISVHFRCAASTSSIIKGGNKWMNRKVSVRS